MHSRVSFIILLLWSFWSFAATPLPQDQAFHLTIRPQDANALNLSWQIKPGYFLYQQRIWVQSTTDKYLHVGSIFYPEPELKMSKQGQQLFIYRLKLDLSIPVLADLGGEFLLNVHYQGCSDEDFCYPPQSKSIKLTFNSDHALTAVSEELIITTPLVTPAPPAQSSSIQLLFTHASLGWILLSFFGFGLLLTFTPCVLPMVPVLSSIIIGHGHTLSTRKAFFLSLSYVLSMSLTYGIIGAIIAKLGANLQIILQSPWVLGSFTLLFVLLALSMFNIYEFRLPLSWQSRIANVTRSQAGGHYLSAALMGSMSILILSPCVTPPLIGALSYIADTGSTLVGLLALFFLGLGMGTPLLLIGTSAGKLLPKAGLWMNTVKYIFGVLLLGMAIHLLSRIISPVIAMMLWSVLAISSGLGLKPFSANRAFLPQAIGIMLMVFGVFILYGASAGHTNPWQPLASTKTITAKPPQHQTVTTLAQAQAALAAAKLAGKPVILDFYATWCDSCQLIEKTTMRSAELSTIASQISIIKVDLSQNDKESQALLTYFKVIAPPTFLFYDAAGNPRSDLRWVGMIHSHTLVARIKNLREVS